MGSIFVETHGRCSMKKTLSKKVAVASLAVMISFSGVSLANAEPVQHAPIEQSGKFKVSAKDVSIINHLRREEGLPSLPKEVDSIKLDSDLKMKGFDKNGKPVSFPDHAVSSKAQKQIQTYDSGDSVMRNAAQAVVGCVAGVVGYDEILDILERRVGKLAFVKFLAKRVGWGLALSCVGGGVSAAMGWE